MMDIVPDQQSKSEKDVKPGERHLRRFIDELEFIGFFNSDRPIIIALGRKVYKTLTRTHPDLLRAKNKRVVIERVSHHGRPGLGRDEFVNEVQELSRRIGL